MARMDMIHPQFLNSIPEQYPDKCDILEPATGTDDWGEPIDDPVVLLANLDCLISADGGDERKRDDSTYVEADYYISLKGYYPDIKENMTARVNGNDYNITLPEHSSRSKRTRLAVEVVE